MRLRAEIVIDLEACDFVTAAEHQTRIEAFCESLQQTYPGTELTFRERRLRSGHPGAMRAASYRLATGNLNTYED